MKLKNPRPGLGGPAGAVQGPPPGRGAQLHCQSAGPALRSRSAAVEHLAVQDQLGAPHLTLIFTGHREWFQKRRPMH